MMFILLNINYRLWICMLINSLFQNKKTLYLPSILLWTSKCIQNNIKGNHNVLFKLHCVIVFVCLPYRRNIISFVWTLIKGYSQL